MNVGIHQISMQDYQRDPAPEPSLSSGIAHRIITQSPLHAWYDHPKLNPKFKSEESSTFDLGACAHAVLLEGEGSIASVEADDWRTKAAKEARDQARTQGKIPVLARKMEEIRAMANVARAAIGNLTEFSSSFLDGLSEQTLLWQEGKTWCRARLDKMSRHRSVLFDYKSTAGSAEPNAWIRNQMIPMGYDMQAVHYLRGNAMTGGVKDSQWIFLVQENYAPFACSFVGLSPALYEIAKRKWDEALALWSLCIERNQWPSYPCRVAYAEPTSWQLGEHEERLLSFGERLELMSV